MPATNFLTIPIIILFVATVVVVSFRRLNMNPVLGYFVAGSFLSQYLNVISAKELHALAELGIVFLLFAIGLEMSLERLKSMRYHTFGFGVMQVVVTVAIVIVLVILIGYGIDTSIVIGGGLGLSSSAIVLQILTEKRAQSTQVGRLSITTLILQDFAVIPLLIMIPLFAKDLAEIGYAITISMSKAIAVLIGVIIMGRLLLRPLFHAIGPANFAHTNEIFIATVLSIVLGTAWLTHFLELSMPLGAFVAGVLIAETEFQHLAEEAIAPFKGLLLGLFFMTIGMEINFSMIINNLGTVLALSLGIILIKSAIIILLCLIFGFSIGTAIHTGLLLSQGGEFAFILFDLAKDHGILDTHISQTLLLVVTTTMAITPLLATIGEYIARYLDKSTQMDQQSMIAEVSDLSDHVIIAGFGRVGKMVARLLETKHIRYIAVDISAEKVSEGRKENFVVYRGDGSQLQILKNMAIDRAMCMISTLDNEITLHKTLKIVSDKYPKCPIIIKWEDLSKAKELKNMGATIVVPEKYETGLQLGSAVLKTVGVSEYEVSRIKNMFRDGEYVLAQDVLDSLYQDDVNDDE